MALPDIKAVMLKGRQQSDSLGTLLSQLATQSAELLRDEVALAKQEIREKALSMRLIALLLIGGATAGLFFIQMGLAAALILLAGKIGWIESAALLSGVCALVSIVMILTGVRWLKQMTEKKDSRQEADPDVMLGMMEDIKHGQ